MFLFFFSCFHPFFWWCIGAGWKIRREDGVARLMQGYRALDQASILGEILVVDVKGFSHMSKARWHLYLVGILCLCGAVRVTVWPAKFGHFAEIPFEKNNFGRLRSESSSSRLCGVCELLIVKDAWKNVCYDILWVGASWHVVCTS